MKVLPRSLFGRHAVLIVLLIALGQIGGALLFRQMVVKPRLEQAAESVARNVGAVHAGLLALPPAERSGFIEAFNQRALAEDALHGASNRSPPTAAGQPVRRALTPLERRFVRSVSLRLVQQGVDAVWRREADGSLALRLTLESRDHWLVTPAVLPAHEFTGAWLVVSVGSALLALAGALWFQHLLNRPLRRLVQAAQTLAQGREPAPLPTEGPTEVATLSRSFNQLVGSLQRADQERALMLAGVSHDLRTPMAKLRLGVEILRDRMEPELFSSMARSVEEMDTVVGQFLDFARGDGVEMAVPADLNALVHQVVAAFADHGKTLQLEAAPTPLVPMRPLAIRRVIVNLVENAFRHGRPPVCLRVGGGAAGVWVEVIDHGAGIAPAQAEQLKQPFQRGERSRSGSVGAGLGLAIVERIVRAHGGVFELLAADGGGLRARVSLPGPHEGASSPSGRAGPAGPAGLRRQAFRPPAGHGETP